MWKLTHDRKEKRIQVIATKRRAENAKAYRNRRIAELRTKYKAAEKNAKAAGEITEMPSTPEVCRTLRENGVAVNEAGIASDMESYKGVYTLIKHKQFLHKANGKYTKTFRREFETFMTNLCKSMPNTAKQMKKFLERKIKKETFDPLRVATACYDGIVPRKVFTTLRDIYEDKEGENKEHRNENLFYSASMMCKEAAHAGKGAMEMLGGKIEMREVGDANITVEKMTVDAKHVVNEFLVAAGAERFAVKRSHFYCAEATLLRRDIEEKKAQLADATQKVFEKSADSCNSEVELRRHSDISAEVKRLEEIYRTNFAPPPPK